MQDTKKTIEIYRFARRVYSRCFVSSNIIIIKLIISMSMSVVSPHSMSIFTPKFMFMSTHPPSCPCILTPVNTHTHDREALYPFLRKHNLDELVEDNASPHNNDVIRDEHKRNKVRLIGYEATDQEKDEIKRLIREQVLPVSD